MSSDLDIQRFLEQTRPWEVRVAPGGNRAAFRAADFARDDGERLRDVFLQELDAETSPHRLNRVSEGALFRWNPDGSKLGFVATREPERERRSVVGQHRIKERNGVSGGHDAGPRQVWVFDFERGGDAIQVTDLPTAVLDFDWSPDGERIVVSGKEQQEEDPVSGHNLLEDDHLPEVSEHDSDESPPRQRCLFVINLTDNEITKLDEAYDTSTHYRFWYRRMHPKWGGNDRITFSATQGTNDNVRNVYSIRPDGTDLRCHTDSNGTYVFPEWGPDGELLSCTKFEGENRHIPATPYVADCSAGEEASPIAPDLDRNVHYVTWYDQDTLIGLVGSEGRWSLYEFDRGENAPHELFSPEVPMASVNYSGVERPFDFDVTSGTVATVVTSPTHVGLYSVSVEEDGNGRLKVANWECVHEFNTGIIEDAPMAATEVEFESDDGTIIEGMVYLPADFEVGRDDPLPVILDTYRGIGGVEIPRYRFRHQYRTSRGYAVFRVRYRGCNTYGEQFAGEVRDQPVVTETADIEAGIRHLIDQGYADPDRVYAVGFGYGATNVVNLMCETDLIRAGAALHGVYDFRSAFGTDERIEWWRAVFGYPWRNKETYERASPIMRADSIDAPLLLVTGEDDERVSPSQTNRLYSELSERGKDVRKIVYSDLGYAAFGPSDVAMHRLTELQRWFESHS